jgi:8-oxo-dGTP pyrophosphatase MutT (NUDIX family)
VVLVRPSSTGWETYFLRRHAASPVLADSWVFPGGTVRADDSAPELIDRSPAWTPADARAALARSEGGAPGDPLECFGYFVAAARELFEEAGILMARPSDSTQLARFEGDEQEKAQLSQLRLATEQGAPFMQVLDELGLVLALDRMVHYAHWVTPPTVPARFDTRFFVAVLPEGQIASPSPFEMEEGEWVEPQAALETGASGQRSIHFATAAQLRRLGAHASVEDLLAFARTKPIRVVTPPTREVNGRLVPFLPPDMDSSW